MMVLRILKLVIAIITILAIHTASAQQITASSYVERTHISPKIGSTAGVLFNDTQIELGVFYQHSMSQPGLEQKLRYFEHSFTGVYLDYPMLNSGQVSFKFNIRTGVTDQDCFVITPSIKINYQVYKRIMLSSGLGVRAFRPTLQAGIKLTINQ